MDRLARELAEAVKGLAPHWTEARSARLFAATEQQRRRRGTRRAVGASVAVASAAALLTVGALGGLRPRQSAPLAQRAQPGVGSGAESPVTTHSLRLADGSRADMVGAQSVLEATQDSPERVELRLLAGRAHFDVVPNRARSFSVEVGPYRVQVIGTVFDVERTEHDVGVGVTRGKVRVSGPSGTVELHVGETQRFAFDVVSAGSAAAPDRITGTASDTEKKEPHARDERDVNIRDESRTRAHLPAPRAETGAATSWRSLSRSGQYEAAFESLRQAGSVDDDPAALMDAADAARLSGHAENAVQYLTRVAHDHRRSPLGPLAAFTLGRVYLEELGQPDKAAEAFGMARQLAPAGSMAQDALAREVESLSKAGNAHQAFVRAREYIERYPGGRRLRAVQLYGGVE